MEVPSPWVASKSALLMYKIFYMYIHICIAFLELGFVTCEWFTRWFQIFVFVHPCLRKFPQFDEHILGMVQPPTIVFIVASPFPLMIFGRFFGTGISRAWFVLAHVFRWGKFWAPKMKKNPWNELQRDTVFRLKSMDSVGSDERKFHKLGVWNS